MKETICRFAAVVLGVVLSPLAGGAAEMHESTAIVEVRQWIPSAGQLTISVDAQGRYVSDLNGGKATCRASGLLDTVTARSFWVAVGGLSERPQIQPVPVDIPDMPSTKPAIGFYLAPATEIVVRDTASTQPTVIGNWREGFSPSAEAQTLVNILRREPSCLPAPAAVTARY